MSGKHSNRAIKNKYMIGISRKENTNGLEIYRSRVW